MTPTSKEKQQFEAMRFFNMWRVTGKRSYHLDIGNQMNPLDAINYAQTHFRGSWTKAECIWESTELGLLGKSGAK